VILTIDIGNSRSKLGLFDGYNLIKKTTVPLNHLDNVEKCKGFISDFIGEIANLTGACICSVVPDKTSLFISAIKALGNIPLIIVNHETKTGIDFSMLKSPKTLGTDRIASAAGAFHIYRKPLCVIDFGTATTLNVVDGHPTSEYKQGRFMGGAILPGLDMMCKSLSDNTAALPLIELTESIKLPSDNTATAIISGIVIGTAGAVERIIDEIELLTALRLIIVITGGNADFVTPYIKKEFIVEPNLSLIGLNVIYNYTYTNLRYNINLLIQ